MAKVGILAASDVSERNMENVLFQIARILATEHTVELIGIRGASDRIRQHFFIFSPKAKRTWPPEPSFLQPLTNRVRLLRSYVQEQQPDLIMAVSGIGMTGLSVALVGRIEGLPSIVRVNSDIFVVQKYKRPFVKRLRLFLKNNVAGRIAIKLATRTILLHNVQVAVLTRAGFARGRFFVVPQPVAFPAENNNDDTARRIRNKYGIPADSYVVGAIGRLDQDKNIRLLYDIIQFVVDRDCKAFFIIVGNGDEKKWLIERISNRRVIFVDEVPRDKLADYYLACNVTIQTSYSEGLSNVIAESLYLGVPVVATDSGPITRAMVSNIGRTTEELARFILSRQVELDPLPPMLEETRNAELWHQLIAETISSI